MPNFWKYLLVVVVVLGLVLIFAIPFFYRGFGGYWMTPALAPGTGVGPGMMGKWGYFPMMGGFGIFGGLMMLFAFLLPVGLVALVVIGAVALLRHPGNPIPPFSVSSGRACPNCGKPVQPDWTTCPYCGQKLL